MSSIEVWKISSGFLQARQRPACQNCAHGHEQRVDVNTYRFRCTLGGFMTSAGAVCNKHQPKAATGAPR